MERVNAGFGLQFVSEGHLSTIKSMIEKGNRLDAAVAFWGAGSIKKLQLDRVKKGSTFVCNLFSAGCNPHEIQKLFNLKRFNILRHEGLHAKVYWTAQAVCIGSSNISDAGLGFDGQPAKNLKQREANILTDDKRIIDDARNWLDKIIQESTEVDQTALDLAKKNYKPGRSPEIIELVDLPLDVIKRLKIAVLVWSVEFEESTIAAFRKIQSKRKELASAEAYGDTLKNAKEYPYGYSVLEFNASEDRNTLKKFQRVAHFPSQKEWEKADGLYAIWSFVVERRGPLWSIPGATIKIGKMSRDKISQLIKARNIRLRHDLHTRSAADGFVTWAPLHELLAP